MRNKFTIKDKLSVMRTLQPFIQVYGDKKVTEAIKNRAEVLKSQHKGRFSKEFLLKLAKEELLLRAYNIEQDKDKLRKVEDLYDEYLRQKEVKYE